MKKAFLVNYAVTTRVVIDVEGKDEEDIDTELHDKAFDNISDPYAIDQYICNENMEYREDTEMPYNKEFDGVN